MNTKMKQTRADDDYEDDLYEESQPPIQPLTNFLSHDGTSLNFHINGAVSQQTLNPIINNILHANMGIHMRDPDDQLPLENLTHINILINSGGGDLLATQQLLTVMDGSSIPVRTVAWGECASAALIILMAGKHRLVSPHALIMSHHASFALAGGFVHAKDKSTSNMTKKIDELMLSFYKKYTGKDQRYIQRYFMKSNKDDMYYSAAETIKHCLADELFTSIDQLMQGC